MGCLLNVIQEAKVYIPTRGAGYITNVQDRIIKLVFNPLNSELNLICHLLALLGARHIFHVSGLRVNIAS